MYCSFSTCVSALVQSLQMSLPETDTKTEPLLNTAYRKETRAVSKYSLSNVCVSLSTESSNESSRN